MPLIPRATHRRGALLQGETNMTTGTKIEGPGRGSRWTLVMWAIAAMLWLLPLIAMRFTREVAWDVFDFVLWGVMLTVAAGTVEVATRLSGSWAYRLGVGVAVAAAFLLIWLNLAVGIIGREDDPANLMFAGVLFVAVSGAFVARFRPDGMARAMIAAAMAQGLVGVIAMVWRLGATGEAWPRPILGLTAFFCAMWLGSAWLFDKAARRGR